MVVPGGMLAGPAATPPEFEAPHAASAPAPVSAAEETRTERRVRVAVKGSLLSATRYSRNGRRSSAFLIPPLAPGLHDPLDVAFGGVCLLDASDLQHATGIAAPFQPGMGAGDLRALMEHKAGVLFALGEEARQVTAIGESRRLPLDALLHPWIGA